MKKAVIQKNPSNGGRSFTTTTANTGISQRTTLEECICNLATALGHSVVYKQESSRGAFFYRLAEDRTSIFQSATNTVLDLSRRLLQQSQQ